MMEDRLIRINRLLKMGLECATCTKRSVAAVLELSDGSLLFGWNGPPICFVEYCKPCPRLDAKSGTRMEECPAIHAEVAVILNAGRSGAGSTKGSKLYITCGLPCKDCMKELIVAGVEEIISPYPTSIYVKRDDGFESGKTYNLNLAYEMMKAAGIKYTQNESILKGSSAHVYKKEEEE